MKNTLNVSVANKGTAEGEALVCSKPFTFRDVNPASGIVDTRGHELEGEEINEKILVCPCTSGISTEEFAMYILKKSGFFPKAIVCGKTAFYISTVGAILCDIPMVYGMSANCLNSIENGDHVKVDGNSGTIEVSAM